MNVTPPPVSQPEPAKEGRPSSIFPLRNPIPKARKLAAKFSGLDCTANLDTGVVTCADPEELQLILQTISANHFNFIHADALPGVQKVVVQARAEAGMLLGGTQLGASSAEAFIGAGALSVNTIRLVKDADGTADLSLN